ncbi:MAG: signal peptidase I [Ruminococcus flavefaciens]|nr:signal peptidase I [Ruminococcus flavefaciens]MCM1229763.1 signal peptidase I [Ruminococcus flavefaciens]
MDINNNNVENIEDEVSVQNPENEEEPKKKGDFLKDCIDIVESTLITIFVVFLIFTYILHPVNIVGHSMVPTLNLNYDSERAKREDTDKIFMSTVYLDIKYGDILVIEKDDNYLLDASGNVYVPSTASIGECIIKRVIAVGGQTVDIRDGKVYVDGELLDEPYINEPDSTSDLGAFTGQYPITIPEGYYFCMGDNRNHSTDSRAASVGLISKDQIYGKAIIKYSPLSEFDILTDSWKG